MLFDKATLTGFHGRVAGALAFLAAAFLGGGVWHVLQSPGEAIRTELQAAAADARLAPANLPADELRRTLRQHFIGQDVTIDTAGFPSRVAVTIHALDRSACVDAASAARRIEGLTVVELEGYRSPDACGERNDMRWQILP